MKRIVAIVVAVCLLAPAVASAQTLTVVNQANVRPWVLARVEQAVQYQANSAVHAHWGSPKIGFGAGGWKVYLKYGNSGCDSGTGGCHWPGPGPWTCDANGCVAAGGFHPYAIVSTQGQAWSDGIAPNWTEDFDHEVIEMVTDPTLGGYEICDPTNGYYEADNGVFLSDFVFPSYFHPGAAGPYDLLHEIHHPL